MRFCKFTLLSAVLEMSDSFSKASSPEELLKPVEHGRQRPCFKGTYLISEIFL